MKNDYDQNNIAKVAGRVVKAPQKSHEIDGEKFYELTLEVKRLSETFDYIPITISERSLNNKKIEVGDRLGVLGEFRSYNRQEEEKSKLILHVFAREVFLNEEIELSQNFCDQNSITEFDVNEVKITGYICKPPIFRETPKKREICDVLIAVNRKNFKSDYLPCIVWGRNAKYMEKQTVGTKMELEGRIQSRIYIKRLDNGVDEQRTAYEISVKKLQPCEIVEDNFQKNKEYKDFLDSSNPSSHRELASAD